MNKTIYSYIPRSFNSFFLINTKSDWPKASVSYSNGLDTNLYYGLCVDTGKVYGSDRANAVFKHSLAHRYVENRHTVTSASDFYLQTSLTLRLLMSYIYIYIYIYIYAAPILDVSRSHTTTQHSR